jgi:hypothetical protein
VRDRDDGLLVAAALDQPAVLGREVAVAFADSAAGALDERRRVASGWRSECGRSGASRRFRCCPGRGQPMRRHGRRWEARHVAAEFGEDGLSGAAGHPGNGVEPRDRVGVGGRWCGVRPQRAHVHLGEHDQFPKVST